MTTEIDRRVDILKSSDALEAVVRGEADLQIRTAKAYPRDLDRAIERATQLAVRPGVAKECSFAVPRGGKMITGPSVRLAEVLQHTWGNLRVGARVIAIDDFGVTCQGVAHDLEANSAISVDVVRRFPKGKATNDDMRQLTIMACASIARRDAIFAIIPKPLWQGIYEAAQAAARGTVDTLKERRDAALAWFQKAGVKQEYLLAKLGKKTVEEITLQDLDILHGLATSIQEGMSTKELFEPSFELRDNLVSKAREPGSDK